MDIQNFRKKTVREITQGARPRGYPLLLVFSVSNLILFVIIGAVVVMFVRPALESFTGEQEDAETVVFANRFASKILTQEDFQKPLTPEKEKRFADFIENVPIQAVVGIFILDRKGEVIYGKPPKFTGASFTGNPDVRRVLYENQIVSQFVKFSAADQNVLGVKEGFVQIVPITFGNSREAAGGVYAISRTGVVRQAIETTRQALTIRILGGLAMLYILGAVIVAIASRIISRQGRELESYAKGLEIKVKERTRDLEESTKKQVEHAEALAKLKDEFVFIAAHELRSPVTLIQWSLDYLEQKKEEKLSEGMKKIFSNIRDATGSLKNLVGDILDVARLEGGTIRLRVRPSDILPPIENAIKTVFPIAEQKNVTITFFDRDTMKVLPPIVGDSDRLQEVFTNLIGNAVKYNRDGGEVTISVKPREKFLDVVIRDTGVGMTKEELEKVFMKFWRANPEIEGTGLGLWISRELVERMGGNISVESVKGKGSTFTVSMALVFEGEKIAAQMEEEGRLK